MLLWDFFCYLVCRLEWYGEDLWAWLWLWGVLRGPVYLRVLNDWYRFFPEAVLTRGCHAYYRWHFGL